MYCPFFSIGKDQPVKCMEHDCGLYVDDDDADLLGCAYTTSVKSNGYVVQSLYELFDGLTVDIEKELHSIAQGTAFIPDLS